MNKRLGFLENLVSSGKADDFARYCLAMEYKKEGRIEDAAQAFEQLRDISPNYVPQYLMAGQMFIDAKNTVQARVWLEAGLIVAQQVGDSKAAGEIESALADC